MSTFHRSGDRCHEKISKANHRDGPSSEFRSAGSTGRTVPGFGPRAKAAARLLAQAPTAAKNKWLLASAAALEAHQAELLAANAKDVAAAPGFGLNAAAIDRLTLDPKRIASAAEGLRQVAALPDPVGEIREAAERPNGLQVLKVGVPLGVVFFIYESRPNVTADAAALCVKSGNAVILRGGKEAVHSNTALHRLLSDELPRAGCPPTRCNSCPTTDRAAVGHLLSLNAYIDLAIPRGGKSLIQRVASEATMPVLKHYDGVCHVYVDAAADWRWPSAIVVNAKCQRPGTCNAAESHCSFTPRSRPSSFRESESRSRHRASRSGAANRLAATFPARSPRPTTITAPSTSTSSSP